MRGHPSAWALTFFESRCFCCRSGPFFNAFIHPCNGPGNSFKMMPYQGTRDKYQWEWGHSDFQDAYLPDPSRLFQVTITGMADNDPAWTVLRVCDERGAVVLDQGFSGAQCMVDMTGEAPGYYTIQLLQDSGHRTTHPIVVQ